MKTIIYNCIILFFIQCNRNNTVTEFKSKSQMDTLVQLTNTQLKNSTIKTDFPKIRSIQHSFNAFGKIETPPQNIVSISAPLGGYLKSILLLPGSRVKKGQVIAYIEDAKYIDLQQEYLTGQSRLRLLNSEFIRIKELFDKSACSKKTFDESESIYETQQILVKSLEEQMALIGLNPRVFTFENISGIISIHSPINGFITSVNFNVGRYLNPSDILLEIVNPSDLHLALSINEKDRMDLFENPKFTAVLNSHPNKSYTGKIILINNHLSIENTLEAHGHFDTLSNDLIPGLFMNATIYGNPYNAITVPESCLFQFKGNTCVFIQIDSNTFYCKPVSVSKIENKLAIIKNIETHQRIVTDGVNEILMNLSNSL